jgi:hypothetical protein
MQHGTRARLRSSWGCLDVAGRWRCLDVACDCRDRQILHLMRVEDVDQHNEPLLGAFEHLQDKDVVQLELVRVHELPPARTLQEAPVSIPAGFP